MATRILGLDIEEESLSAVVVEQRGTERVILSCGSLEIEGFEQISVVLPELLQQVGFKSGPCILGLPLSIISLRNLTLPFTDHRKMVQVLPLELEEQLLVPIDDQVVDFMVTGRVGAGSRLLVAALEKEYLHTLIPILEENGLAVQRIAPAISTLAREHMQGWGKNDPTLFLQAGSQTMNMAFWADGRVIFMRHVAYSENVFIESFDTLQREVGVLDRETLEKGILSICETIKTSLYYFQQDPSGGIQAEVAILSGDLSGENEWRELIGRELELDVVVRPLPRKIPGIRFSGSVAEQWNPDVFDSAFALALSGLKKQKKSEVLNFLQGEFSSASWFLLSKRSLMAAAAVLILICSGALGYLWTDYRALDARSSSLRQEMNDVFKTTFPEVTRIVDPLVQMQSKLREVQTSEVSLPLFSGEKRVLEILADISARIPKQLSLHVSRLVIDKESVQIKGTTDAYNNVDVIKNKLAASSRYAAVKIVSATADKKKGKIRFEIRLQLAEAS